MNVADEIDEIRALSDPLENAGDLDHLLERIGDTRIVLLGEASHGTSDYYRWRAAITRRLIVEKGFDFVAVEGDWPDCFLVNRWVKGRALLDHGAVEVLRQFERWPTWMWANHEVAEFIDWVREHNRRTGREVGFYGLDVYSLWDSLRAVFGYVREQCPEALEAAHAVFDCFEPYEEDPQHYAWATRAVPTSCENEVIDLLVELHRGPRIGDHNPEAELDALQNAEVLAGAERYYRTMVRADAESWNIRDTHMADTLARLLKYQGSDAKAVIWEHNTHVGDARATDMAAHGMVNVGQLARERHGESEVFLVGFGGYRGTVIAAGSWGAPMRKMSVPEAPYGVHERLIHEAVGRDGLLVFPSDRSSPWLSSRRGHRAIGVVYDPNTERRGNWVPTVMGRRYDAFCYFDTTEALHPLHMERPRAEELETYPWAT